MESADKIEHLVLVGGGGHCRSCIEAIESIGAWRITGIVDPATPEGGFIQGYPVLGDDSILAQLVETRSSKFLITLGQVKASETRKHLYSKIIALGGVFPHFKAPTSSVSKRAIVGGGTIILPHAIVNIEARIGENCIVNTRALIEHDVIVGSHSHVATSAVVNGGAQIGENCMIGSCSVIIQGISICNNVLVGAGAVVVRDIREPGTYVGNPAKKVR